MTAADFKEFYEREWERREQLQSAANTPISIVTLLVGGIVLMMKGFDATNPALCWWFWAGAGIAVLLVATAVVFIIRAIHGWEYERIPYPSDLAKHHELLQDYHRRKGQPAAAADAFANYLATRYMIATDANAENNLRRGEYLDRANRFLVYGLCATTTAAIPAGIAVKAGGSQVQDIRVINLRSDGRELLKEWNGARERSAGARAPAGERHSAGR